VQRYTYTVFAIAIAIAIASVCSPKTDSYHPIINQSLQNRQELVLNMTDYTNFNASAFPGPTMTVSVPVMFACQHTELCTLSCPSDSAFSGFMNDGPCGADACQKRFVNKMRSELQLAGMNCEAALRKFAQCEPMLKQELAYAGCPCDMIEALLNCSQRSAATSTYLGHRAALSFLAEYEISTDKQRAGALVMQLILTNRSVQHKLLAIQSTVLRLSQNSYPAPGLKFPMIEGINSHDPSWGKQQLATLQSTNAGRVILALPLTNDNILAAKTSMLVSQNELAELAQLHASERAAFFHDYPGTEKLHATGAMRSSQEMIDDMPSQGSSSTVEQESPEMQIDSPATTEFSSADIRSLRPETRVASKKMVAHTCLGVDMAKVNAYSGKSYEALTNPWWAAKKA
jgi:hypothetical protein